MALEKDEANSASELEELNADNAVDANEHSQRSRVEDVGALVEDALAYVDAEFSFQKTRASFVADGIKKIVVFALVAVFLAILAITGLVIGLIIALTPLITGWGATGVVVGVLLLIAYILVRKALSTLDSTMSELKKPDIEADELDEEAEANG